MPEVVSTFIGANNFGMAYEVQSKIVDANLDDIARYAAKTDKRNRSNRSQGRQEHFVVVRCDAQA